MAALLAGNGLALRDVSKLFYLNLFQPIAEMKAKHTGVDPPRSTPRPRRTRGIATARTRSSTCRPIAPRAVAARPMCSARREEGTRESPWCGRCGEDMLIDELEIASRVMPGLVKALSARDMMDLEASGGEVLARLFREQGEPAFLVPREMGGAGGSLLEMAQVLRVVGARCPSLSIMMTMHHHTVATFSRRGLSLPGGEAFLTRIAGARALVASAFAEGRPGADVLDSTVRCTRLEAGAGCKIVGCEEALLDDPPCGFRGGRRVGGRRVGGEEPRNRSGGHEPRRSAGARSGRRTSSLPRTAIASPSTA